MAGSGGSLGEALIDALAAEAGGQVGVLKSYTAVGWHAQISKLTSSPRGYQAAATEGLSVNRKTLMDWLTERRAPNAQNQRKIASAYRRMGGSWPAHIERREVKVSGKVGMGLDVRERGTPDASPFLIDGSAGSWSRMKEAWESGEPDPEDFEEWFIEDVIEEDIGEGSEPWEFPGTSYTVKS